MSSPPLQVTGKAEKAFREAFERLKSGKPERLPKGAPVSQNNVAKETGLDPSALKKSRYPSLISEIQRWVEENHTEAPPSPRQKILAQRKRNRVLNLKVAALKVQRDRVASLLVEADAKIIELTMEITRLQTLLPPPNVNPFRQFKD